MDVHLILDTETPRGETLSVAGGVAAVYSARSPDKQTRNEDAAAGSSGKLIDHSGSGFPFVSGANGSTSTPST